MEAQVIQPPKTKRSTASLTTKPKKEVAVKAKSSPKAKAPSDKADSPELDRTHSAWLLRDDKMLLDGLNLNVYAIAEKLCREPISVLRRLREDRVFDALDTRKIAFDFELNSEEECEFYGLTLAGVPLESALRWCMALPGRSTEKQLKEMMIVDDFRPAMHAARSLGIWFSKIEDMEEMRFLEEMPPEITMAAVAEVLERFEAPTVHMVAQQVEGVVPAKDRPYVWAVHNQTPPDLAARPYKTYSKARRGSAKTGAKTYRKKTSSSTWKPKRWSRRKSSARA